MFCVGASLGTEDLPFPILSEKNPANLHGCPIVSWYSCLNYWDASIKRLLDSTPLLYLIHNNKYLLKWLTQQPSMTRPPYFDTFANCNHT